MPVNYGITSLSRQLLGRNASSSQVKTRDDCEDSPTNDRKDVIPLPPSLSMTASATPGAVKFPIHDLSSAFLTTIRIQLFRIEQNRFFPFIFLSSLIRAYSSSEVIDISFPD